MVAIRLLVAPLARCALFGLFVAELVLSLLGALDLETTVTLCHMPSFGRLQTRKKRRPESHLWFRVAHLVSKGVRNGSLCDNARTD